MTCIDKGLNRFHIHTYTYIFCCLAFVTIVTEYWAFRRTCSVETGPTVVVGIVQHQHNGWSWSFRSWCAMCGNSSGCSSAGSCGASSCGGSGCGSCCGRDFSDSDRFSHSGVHAFQDHFSSSVLWLALCDVMDSVRFGWMVCEGGEVDSQARWQTNKSEIHKASFHSKYSRWI